MVFHGIVMVLAYDIYSNIPLIISIECMYSIKFLPNNMFF